MKIILVFKTHFDIGFTDLSKDVIAQYQTKMLPQAMETCRQTADLGPCHYIWTLPAWPLEVMQENESLRPELNELIHRGQIAWHALPYTSHFDFSGLEDAIQGLRYAVDLSKTHGRPLPVSAKMTDVPGHGRALPALLAGAGIRFLHLGCNAFATPPSVPPLFFWEGMDGSRVLTMYSKGGYGSSLVPPADWPFPVWMALMHTHDNCGPQTAEMINAMVAQVRETHPEAEVLCGTMDDFYHALSACDLSGLPVVRKDLADSWIHGAGSYPAEVRLVRQARRDLVAAGASAFLAGNASLSPAATAAYDALALFDEHTWGMDVKTFLSPDRVYEKKQFNQLLDSQEYRRIEASWDEQRQRANTAASQAKAALAASGQDGLSVLNPNGAAFTGWADAAADTAGCLLLCGEPKVYVEAIPALSAVPLPVQSALKTDSPLENHRYRLSVDRERGVITQLFDKKLGKVLLQERDGVGVFSYRYDVHGIEDGTEYLRSYGYRFFDWGIRDNMKDQYPEVPHQTFPPQFLGLDCQGHTLTLSYQGGGVTQFGDAAEVRVEVSLPPLGDELFLHVLLQGKEKTPMTESAGIAFPLAEDAPRYLFNKNGDLLDPAADIAHGANHALYCVEQFLCSEAAGSGVCLLSKDAPLFSIGETGIYTFRKEYQPHAPILYCNLFNNMWGTNFPQWIGGDLSYRFTLFGYEDTAQNAVYARALSLAQGVSVLPIAPKLSDLSLPEGVQVMGLLPEGAGWQLHLRDTALAERFVTLKSPGLRFTPVDLRGSVLGPTTSEEITVTMRPFGLLAFHLE